jgi:hypothetical protein
VYTPGLLLYFDPFHFEDGNHKPKYFLVLGVTQQQVVLASLPSSRFHLPADLPFEHGCVDQPVNGINCYLLEANRPITTNGWAFPFRTILYGNCLSDFEIDHLRKRYVIEGVDYEVVGTLQSDELQRILDCFRHSSVVKRKYRRWLQG